VSESVSDFLGYRAAASQLKKVKNLTNDYFHTNNKKCWNV